MKYYKVFFIFGEDSASTCCKNLVFDKAFVKLEEVLEDEDTMKLSSTITTQYVHNDAIFVIQEFKKVEKTNLTVIKG